MTEEDLLDTTFTAAALTSDTIAAANVNTSTGKEESIEEKDELIQRLTLKVSSQAKELQDLNSRLEISRSLQLSPTINKSFGKFSPTELNDSDLPASTSLKDASRSSFLFSSTAAQRRYEKEHHESMVAMQRQLDLTEAKLADHIKARRKLIQELDSKTRESKFLIKRCQEIQKENDKMRLQMEHALRVKENSVLALQQKNHSHGPGVYGNHNKALSTSIGLTTKQLSIKTSEKIYSQQLLEEVKLHSELLEETKKELQSSKHKEEQLKLKVKVLEDALEVRSEEIGLSGHSDLLTKVAKLRGEVSALKEELKAKRDDLYNQKEDQSNLQETHASLQSQMKILQERLAASQQETYRLQQGDLGNMLKAAENERDRLLTFIQNDMKKSIELTKQVEQLEAKQRNRQELEDNLKEQNNQLNVELEKEKQRLKKYEIDDEKESKQIFELQRNLQQMQQENESLSQKLGQKTVEAEELNKVQMKLFMQIQGKDEELLKNNEDIVKLKAKVREFEYSVPGLNSDKVRIQEELDETRQSLINAQRTLREVEPELERIRPEYLELRNERGTWEAERIRMKTMLSELQPLKQLLDELHEGIAGLEKLEMKSSSFGIGESKVSSLEELASRSPSYIQPLTPLAGRELSPGKTEILSPPPPPPADIGTGELSRRHSMWVGLPQLRNLSAQLYEKIRSMAHDLHIKEIQCLELQRSLVRVRNEVNVGKKENETCAQQLQIMRDGSNHTIAALQERISVSEAEADHNRGAKALLEQIKVVMVSYPASLEALELDHMNKFISSDMTGNNASYLLEKVTDKMLPELIGKALLYNSSAITELAAASAKLKRLEEDSSERSRQYEELQRQKIVADNLVFDLKDKLSIAAAKLNSTEEECVQRVGEAAELAEKQNALILSLEAKIEALQRDQKLRIAQITALQQRDSSIRSRLLATLHEVCQFLEIPGPEETSKVTDLLQFVTQLLKEHIGDTSAAVGNRFNRNSDGTPAQLFPESAMKEHKTPLASTKKRIKSTSKKQSSSSGSGSEGKQQSTRKMKSKTTPFAKVSSAEKMDSHAAALQDRLKKAQSAFAAMKET